MKTTSRATWRQYAPRLRVACVACLVAAWWAIIRGSFRLEPPHGPTGPFEQRIRAQRPPDGWKDIAAYLGRGVRTAQRWERELGLPIHRLRTGSGEVVYADRAEIDAWIRRQSDAGLAREEGGTDATATNGSGRNADGPIADGLGGTAANADSGPTGPVDRQWRVTAVVAGLVAVAALAAAGWLLKRGPSPGDVLPPAPSPAHSSAQPASLAASTDTLIALDADRRQVWQQSFDAPIEEYNPQQPALFRRAWDILDLDGDASNEAIFARANPADPRVYGFNRDGSIRFTESIDTPIRFGEYACPPVMFTHVFREQRPDFPGTFFAAAHHPMFFPGVLRRLDADGRAAGEYWSNGYITQVVGMQIGGRWATLVGASHNETGGASLAVFFGNVGGSAPATSAAYRCEGCEAGGPDIFIVFPRSRLQRRLKETASINAITAIGLDRLLVSVVIAGVPEADRHCCGQALYTLDRDFRVVGTELGGSYASLQQAIEAEHRVSAATRFRDPADFFPVRRWHGTGWEVIRGSERPRSASDPRTTARQPLSPK